MSWQQPWQLVGAGKHLCREMMLLCSVYLRPNNNCYHNDNGELEQELYASPLNLLKNLQISLLAIVRTTEGGAQPPGLTVKSSKEVV